MKKLKRVGKPRPAGKGLRQIFITKVRMGLNSKNRRTDYSNLFILPINRISNRGIEHNCHQKYIS